MSSTYVIKLDQGDYLEERGGFDWGRTDQSSATVYGSRKEAEKAINGLRLWVFGAVIEEAN